MPKKARHCRDAGMRREVSDTQIQKTRLIISCRASSFLLRDALTVPQKYLETQLFSALIVIINVS